MAPSRLTHTQAVCLMVLACLLWAMAGVVSRQMESASRFEVTFWRSAFSALSLMLILPLWRWRTRLQTVGKPAAHGLLERH